MPSFAFVNGAAIGGGLELALHCSYRTMSAGVAAVAFPECFLGLLPGWGGTYLLPRLVGPAAALKVIIENPLSQNRMLKPTQARSTRHRRRDVRARRLPGRVAPLGRPGADRRGRRCTGFPPAEDWDAAVAASARCFADAQAHGAAPAPYRALDLIAAARTAARDEGFAAEDEALADLLSATSCGPGSTPSTWSRSGPASAAGAPDTSLARPVTKVGVVGAGLMAAQLALLFARRLEVPVVLTDLDQARLDKGVGHVRGEIATLASRGRISPDTAARLKALVTGSPTKDAFADADFVIEAVFEEI